MNTSVFEPGPLRADPSCCNRANWCTELPPAVGGILAPGDPARIEGLMAENGWWSRCRHPRLKVLRHPAGHEIAWVVATGRVQIRVDLTISSRLRRRYAVAMYEELRACVRRLGSTPCPAARDLLKTPDE